MTYDISGFAVTGTFTDTEWARLLDIIREIEQTRPEEAFRITVHAASGTGLDDAEALLRATWAPSPDPDVTLQIARIPASETLPALGPGADDPEDVQIARVVRRQLLGLTTRMMGDLVQARMGGSYLKPEEADALGNLAFAVDRLTALLAVNQG